MGEMTGHDALFMIFVLLTIVFFTEWMIERKSR